MKRLELLTDLQNSAIQCTECPLHKNRVHSVFSRGNYQASVMLVGEAGGKEENKQGRPFVGLAGSLLNRLLKELDISSDLYYITNVCCCSPPNNRTPFLNEIEICSELFLFKQIDIIQPKVIVALGKTASLALLGPGPGILKQRGNWSKYKEFSVLPTLHPSFCLRQPEYEAILKTDLQAAFLCSQKQNHDHQKIK